MGEARGGWKREVLADFERWLAELPEAGVPGPESAGLPGRADEADLAGPDLHSLYSAFLALRQEVRLQTREQARTVRSMERAVTACDAAAEALRTCQEQLSERETRVRSEAVRRCVVRFLEVYDALLRGCETADAAAGRRGLFRRVPPGVEGVAQGYRMALKRFDEALAQMRVRRVDAIGRRFDPRTMVALEARTVEGAADECVLEEARSGFLMGEEVLRPAEVVVNRER